ncbi:transposase [Gimesia aquarii]|uniref:Transposase IS200 like protein n=1 Tax=Gimesia aquarii TaxID=2527964 RepID=A0A517WUU7_9PLAN|nr:transposase [Gimesia aquarii]QDU09039.1 Transposase IS200 like protein [Gimesia aquarii]
MNLARRKMIRLPRYDYSQAGFYFLTICTQNSLSLFGEIQDGVMNLNSAGEMVQKWWGKVEEKFPDMTLHEFVVMPNHLHGIVEISRRDKTDVGDDDSPTVAKAVQWFKTMSMNEYIRGVKQNGWPRFSKRLWQRNYYEHIIRDEEAYYEIAEYIKTNPPKLG